MSNVHIMSIDYDGCGQYPSVRTSIYQQMYQILSTDRGAIIVVMNGSSRQTNFLNLYTHYKCHKNGNAFRMLHGFANLAPGDDKVLNRVGQCLIQYKDRIRLGKLLMEDIELGQPPGTNFDRGLSLSEQQELQEIADDKESIPWLSQTKRSLVACQLNHCFEIFPQATSMTYHFFDDKPFLCENVLRVVESQAAKLPRSFRAHIYQANSIEVRLENSISGLADKVLLPPATKDTATAFYVDTLHEEMASITKHKLSWGLFVTFNSTRNSQWQGVCSLLASHNNLPPEFLTTMLELAVTRHDLLLVLLKYGHKYYLEWKDLASQLQPLFNDYLVKEDIDNLKIMYPYINSRIGSLWAWVKQVSAKGENYDCGLFLEKMNSIFANINHPLQKYITDIICAGQIAFMTGDGDRAWTVLLNINPFRLGGGPTAAYMLSALQAFALISPPDKFEIKNISDLVNYFLSFRLFTESKLKTDSIDREEFNRFVAMINVQINFPLPENLPRYPKQPLKYEAGLIGELHRILRGKEPGAEINNSILELKIMLAKEEPDDIAKINNLLERWGQKFYSIWHPWVINANCNNNLRMFADGNITELLKKACKLPVADSPEHNIIETVTTWTAKFSGGSNFA